MYVIAMHETRMTYVLQHYLYLFCYIEYALIHFISANVYFYHSCTVSQISTSPPPHTHQRLIIIQGCALLKKNLIIVIISNVIVIVINIFIINTYLLYTRRPIYKY